MPRKTGFNSPLYALGDAVGKLLKFSPEEIEAIARDPELYEYNRRVLTETAAFRRRLETIGRQEGKADESGRT